MNCAQCGKLVAAGDKFCGGCGIPVARSEVSAQGKKKACPVCKHTVAVEKSICPNCGRRFDIEELRAAARRQSPKGQAIGLGCLLLMVAAVAWGLHSCMSESPQEAAQRVAKEKAAAAEAAEEHRKGFDCLNNWDGSNDSLVEQIKSNLRNPDSFQHIETKITPVNAQGQHMVIMEYRAQNGFGGMNVASALATVDPVTCRATIVSNYDGG